MRVTVVVGIRQEGIPGYAVRGRYLLWNQARHLHRAGAVCAGGGILVKTGEAAATELDACSLGAVHAIPAIAENGKYVEVLIRDESDGLQQVLRGRLQWHCANRGRIQWRVVVNANTGNVSTSNQARLIGGQEIFLIGVQQRMEGQSTARWAVNNLIRFRRVELPKRG